MCFSQVVELRATASQVDLWWPNGVGRQPLYNVSASVGVSNGSATATRRIGFRTFALVTGGGTPPSDLGPTLTNGMYFRVNGAKKPVLVCAIVYKSDRFTKTGSGQT